MIRVLSEHQFDNIVMCVPHTYGHQVHSAFATIRNIVRKLNAIYGLTPTNVDYVAIVDAMYASEGGTPPPGAVQDRHMRTCARFWYDLIANSMACDKMVILPGKKSFVSYMGNGTYVLNAALRAYLEPVIMGVLQPNGIYIEDGTAEYDTVLGIVNELQSKRHSCDRIRIHRVNREMIAGTAVAVRIGDYSGIADAYATSVDIGIDPASDCE